MDMIKNINKPVFIIAHKYYRGYDSYCEYYVQTIQKFYEESLIIIVDNNSTHKEDIFEKLRQYENVILLDNNIECKFEIGAYQIGLKYLIDNSLTNDYSYVVLTQDTFILKNKLDFNTLHNQNVKACTINSYFQDGAMQDISNEVLSKLKLLNNLDKCTFCWCCSFIISTSNVNKLYDYFKQIVITNRTQSCAAERYLARILWELNDHQNYDIDGDIRYLGDVWNHVPNPDPKYDCHSVNPFDDNIKTFFVKRAQQKTELTVEK
jgi:hypothetical protein